MKDILFLNQWQESYKHYNKSVKEIADHLGESISWAFTKEVTFELRLKKPKCYLQCERHLQSEMEAWES